MPDEAPSGGSGLDNKTSALLAYLLGIVGGIVFYSISKDSFVRFHAMQSILLSIAMVVVWFVFFIIMWVVPFFFFLSWIFWLGLLAIWIIAMIKAYQGERFKLPIIGQMAENYSK